jgi:hypothetical protein
MSFRPLPSLTLLALLLAPPALAEPVPTVADRAAAMPVTAAPLDALALALGGWVAADLGLPLPGVPPRIRFADPADLAAMHRAGSAGAPAEPGGAVLALYDPAEATIHLPTGWTGATPAELSILVHEMAHHLQAVAGRRFACPAEAEREAYGAQARWLATFGLTLLDAFALDPLFLIFATNCLPP